MTTYIFNSSSRSKILFGVFRSIKIKIRTSGLLLATSYNFVNIGIFKDFMSGVVDQHFSRGTPVWIHPTCQNIKYLLLIDYKCKIQSILKYILRRHMELK